MAMTIELLPCDFFSIYFLVLCLLFLFSSFHSCLVAFLWFYLLVVFVSPLSQQLATTVDDDNDGVYYVPSRLSAWF